MDLSTEPLLTDRRPLHIRVQEHLRTLIAEGVFRVGQQLPPETKLAAELGVSRPTLREALRGLEQAGLIIRRHGVGTFVASHAPTLESGLEVLESLECQVCRLGLRTEVVWHDIVERPATSEEMTMLLLPQGKPIDVLRVDREIAIKGESIAYLRDVVPQAYLRQEDLGEQFTGSVLDILIQQAAPLPVISRTTIVAEGARAQVASRLRVPRGTALLKLIGQLFSHEEEVLDYSISYFIPGHFKFHVMRRVGRDDSGHLSYQRPCPPFKTRARERSD